MTCEHYISKKEDLNDSLESHPLYILYGGENAFLLKAYKDEIVSAGLRLTKAYSPHEPVMSYFPSPRQQKREEIKEIMAKEIGKSQARILCNTEVSRRLFFHLLTLLDETPGRFYSFFVVEQ